MQGWFRKKKQREGINGADRYNPSFCIFNIPRRAVWRGFLSQKIEFPKVNQGEATTAKTSQLVWAAKEGADQFQKTRIVQRGL